MRIERSMLEEVLQDKNKVQLCPTNQINNRAILIPKNIYYLFNSPSKFISLALLNNHEIYYNNKNKKLYKKFLRKIFTLAKR